MPHSKNSHHYQLREFSTPKDLDSTGLKPLVCRHLKVSDDLLRDFAIERKSLDSRKKNRPLWKYNVRFAVSRVLDVPGLIPRDVSPSPNEETLELPKGPIAIIGSGPAGMFAAYELALKGYPVHVYEQGSRVKKRAGDLRRFIKQNEFNPHSNILNGEGGAGTFSDGKLTARNKNAYTDRVLDVLVNCGAAEDIRYLAHPHIGTDRLQFLVTALREKIESLGGIFHFDTFVGGVTVESRKVTGIQVGEKRIPYSTVVIAAGHSARHLYRELLRVGVAMEPSEFSVGVRAEHPQKLINTRQLGGRANPKDYGAAEYYFTYKERDQRAYSFCMCPGGVVVACTDVSDGIATNGMSYHSRATAYANSALVVPVEKGDYASNDYGDSKDPTGVLNGMRYQEQLEKKAYELAGGNFSYPAQTIRGYLEGRVDGKLPASSFQRPLVARDLSGLFTEKVNVALKAALLSFDKKIPGFIGEGLLIGPESRTSSPVRLVRNPDTLESIGTSGLFPLGEGAGYSGGIVSSGADGVRWASLVETPG